ncbi:MAG: DUF5301 domain-containing protein [Oscillospiraceae bacterium]|nr:DUF5301 domain-containing protein [Oscillospiraceae bacterium]
MKKQTVYFLLLFLVQLIFPVCKFTALANAWEFSLFSEPIFLLLMATVTVGLTVALCRLDDAVPSRLAHWLFPMTVIGGLFCLWGTRSLMGAPCAFVCCICAGILFHKFGRKGAGRVFMLMVTVVLIFALVLSGAADLFAEVMSKVTVMREIPSPEGTFTAKVIDADYGATGGDTLVRVYDNSKTVNILLGSFTPKSELGYRGEWGRWDELEISWLDDHILMLNGDARIVCGGPMVCSIYVGDSFEAAIDGEPFEATDALFEALGKSRTTRIATIQDHPGEDIICRITLDGGTLFLYEKDGVYYIEQPYQGVWEADESLLQLLEEYS